MNTTLWIITAVAAAAYLAGGVTLLLASRQRYRALANSQHWVDDFDDRQLKVIGAIKVAGAVGLIVPGVLGIAPILTPVAACGLALFMAGAATTRFRRGEWLSLAGDIVFIAVFVFLAWGRFQLPVG